MRATILALVSASLLLSACCGGGDKSCDKDTDCKGSRVCVDGQCRSGGKRNAPANNPAPAANNPAPRQWVATVAPPAGRRHGIVRMQPSFNSPEVVQLARGTVVTVLGVSVDRGWRHIRWSNGDGWIHHDVLVE
jgi:hypothetical protein